MRTGVLFVGAAVLLLFTSTPCLAQAEGDRLASLLSQVRASIERESERADPEAAVRIAAEARLLEALARRAELARGLPAPVAARLRANIRRQIDRLTLRLARAIDRVPPFGFGIGLAPRPVEEVGLRLEADLGTPSCSQPSLDDGASFCQDGPWLATRSPNFVTIQRRAFLRGSFQQPAGQRVASSFVAERARTAVAVHFSAEAYVEDDEPGSNRRLFVRALLDGAPIEPSNVVFAVGPAQSPRSMIFVAEVEPGIHTVEIQWLVDQGATGFLRNASVFVRTGQRISNNGTLAVGSEPGGVTPPSTTSSFFQDIPGMGRWVYVPPNGVLTASLAGETFVTGGTNLAMVVRALVDGTPLAPSNVVFRRGQRIQSHAYTFGTDDVSPGWHFVEFQWFAEAAATVTLADRAFAIAAYPSPSFNPTHPYVSPPSGPNVTTSDSSFQPVPGLSATVRVGPRGNGEVAAIVSAEVLASNGSDAVLALAVDGNVLSEDETAFTDGAEAAQAKSFVFPAKRLPPGDHVIAVHWRVVGGGTAGLGDRSLALASETGFLPDIAEALPLSPARFTEIEDGMVEAVDDNIVGLEPLVGQSSVLTLLWDPERPDQPNSDSLPAAQIEDMLYAASESMNDYIREASGNRFAFDNAGVLGWFEAPPEFGGDLNTPFAECFMGYKNKQIGKRIDALRQADAIFDFSAFDANADGFLAWQELAILLVIPQIGDTGFARVRVVDKDCDPGPLVLDGVEIPDITEWFTDAEGLDYMVAAHELAHQVAGLDDLYRLGASADKAQEIVGATSFSLMSLVAEGGADAVAPHPGPFHKLALGWVTPVLVQDDGVFVLSDVKTSDRVLVLPRYNNEARDDEYLILENRQADPPGLYDDNIGDSGVAIWHVVSDPQDNQLSPRGVPDDDWVPFGIQDVQLRRSVRLLRRFTSYDAGSGEASANQDQPLWDPFGSDLLSADCDTAFPDNFAAWGDCGASGYSVQVLTPVAPTMLVRVLVD